MSMCKKSMPSLPILLFISTWKIKCEIVCIHIGPSKRIEVFSVSISVITFLFHKKKYNVTMWCCRMITPINIWDGEPFVITSWTNKWSIDFSLEFSVPLPPWMYYTSATDTIWTYSQWLCFSFIYGFTTYLYFIQPITVCKNQLNLINFNGYSKLAWSHAPKTSDSVA